MPLDTALRAPRSTQRVATHPTPISAPMMHGHKNFFFISGSTSGMAGAAVRLPSQRTPAVYHSPPAHPASLTLATLTPQSNQAHRYTQQLCVAAATPRNSPQRARVSATRPTPGNSASGRSASLRRWIYFGELFERRLLLWTAVSVYLHCNGDVY